LRPNFADEFQPEVRDNMMQLLRQLIRLNLVRRKMLGGVLLVSPGAIVQLENIIVSAGVPATNMSAGSPVASAPPASSALSQPVGQESGDARPPVAAANPPTPARVSEGTAAPAAPLPKTTTPPPNEPSNSLLDSARQSLARRKKPVAPPTPGPQDAARDKPNGSAHSDANGPTSPFDVLAVRAARIRVDRDS
jgi:hypothetical protein